MAARTPDTTGVGAINGFTEVIGADYAASTVNPLDAADVLTTAVAAGAEAVVHDRRNAALVIKYFSDIDDTDTWSSGYRNVLAAAFQADDLDADFVSAHVLDGRTGVITFQTAAAATALAGWVWLLVEREGNAVPAGQI